MADDAVIHHAETLPASMKKPTRSDPHGKAGVAELILSRLRGIVHGLSRQLQLDEAQAGCESARGMRPSLSAIILRSLGIE